MTLMSVFDVLVVADRYMLMSSFLEAWLTFGNRPVSRIIFYILVLDWYFQFSSTMYSRYDTHSGLNNLAYPCAVCAASSITIASIVTGYDLHYAHPQVIPCAAGTKRREEWSGEFPATSFIKKCRNISRRPLTRSRSAYGVRDNTIVFLHVTYL
jgi:hypothetical protein